MGSGWSIIMPREKSYVVVPFFCLVKKLLCSIYLSLLSSDYVTRIVTCFHEYVMKKYEVIALYVIAIVKVVAKCSIIITNPNCGKHTPNKCYRKHISVLDKVIREGKRRKLHHHQRSSEMRVWSPKRLDPPMLERRRLWLPSNSATSFFRALIRVSITSTAG